MNLDFAYLAELTRLDHHLRKLVLSMMLDIERYMKVHLNRTMMDDGADGKEVGIDHGLVALTRRFPVIHDFTALVLCFDRIVNDADARSEKAAGLRTLRGRLLEHADYFEKQIELDRGIRMLGESCARGPMRCPRIPYESPS